MKMPTPFRILVAAAVVLVLGPGCDSDDEPLEELRQRYEDVAPDRYEGRLVEDEGVSEGVAAAGVNSGLETVEIVLISDDAEFSDIGDVLAGTVLEIQLSPEEADVRGEVVSGRLLLIVSGRGRSDDNAEVLLWEDAATGTRGVFEACIRTGGPINPGCRRIEGGFQVALPQ
jgi:hypothetical protein